MNDLNRLHYTIFGDPATLAAVRTTLLLDKLAFISSASASNSAAIDFTSGITSTFDEYLITLTDILPATDNVSLIFRYSEDSGSTFKAGASDYGFSVVTSNDGGAPGGSGSASTTGINIGVALGNTASKGFCGDVRFFNPAGTTKHKFNTSHCVAEISSGEVSLQIGAGKFKLDTNAVNGFRFLMSSGNITSGNFALYGVRKV